MSAFLEQLKPFVVSSESAYMQRPQASLLPSWPVGVIVKVTPGSVGLYQN